MILQEAGVPLVDRVGSLVLDKVEEGAAVRLEDDRLFADGLVGVGVRQDRASILRDMDAAREAVDERFEGFARGTLEYMREERDLLFGGAGLPRSATRSPVGTCWWSSAGTATGRTSPPCARTSTT